MLLYLFVQLQDDVFRFVLYELVLYCIVLFYILV